MSEVVIPLGEATIKADLEEPTGSQGLVVFAHGSGSSRRSLRNRYVAEILQDAGFGTLLLDLLTESEERVDERSRHLRFDIALLAARLSGAVDWLDGEVVARHTPIGYFGASTGAAAALAAAAQQPARIAAVVSRGGRADLAGDALRAVHAPTLLIVGSHDDEVVELNRAAAAQLTTSSIEVIQGASHLFEESGALEQVARLATDWFSRYLSNAVAERSAS